MSKTNVWREYELGIDYKSKIGLYSTVDLNERFYAGDQWVGIPHEGLPTPVVNFIKYASAWKIAAVTDRRLELEFFAEGISDGEDIGTYARQISNYCDSLWERLKMDYLTKEGLKQAAITGDYVQYFYWDSQIKTGQSLTGDINTMLVDNVNYYPGNPNDPDVQSQPYIIIVFRELISKVKQEAKQNGCKNIDDIKADDDNTYTSGDMGKIELDDLGKCNVLLKMYKKDGRVFCEKSVKDVIIQKEKDTNLCRYPVALMNWETRKNCCHGTAEVSGLIPNQVFVNKILALSQLNQVQTSFPKVIFDKTRIKEWTNKVAGAIAVNGDIGGAAQYMSLPNMAYDAWKGFDVTLDTTMRMMGANDVTLGNIRNPDNASAFIATRDAAMVPLQSQQERFYSFVEDVGLIWLDFIRNFYKTGRMIPVEEDGKRTYVPLPDEVLDEYTMNLRVDVGPSSMWSEIQVLQTLDNLLMNGQISFAQYLERIPDGHIPMKEELIEQLNEAEQGGAQREMGMPQTMPGMGMPQMPGGLPVDMGQGISALPAMPAPEQALPEQISPEQEEKLKIVIDEIASAAVNGSIPKELADGLLAMTDEGISAKDILLAMETAAEQGMIEMEVVKKIAQAADEAVQKEEYMPTKENGQIPEAAEQQKRQAPPEMASPEQVLPEQEEKLKIVIDEIASAAVNGSIPKELADGLLAMTDEGVNAKDILLAMETAVEQGMIEMEVVKSIAQAAGI